MPDGEGTRPHEAPPAGVARLALELDDGRRYPLDGTLVIGHRSGSAQIRLDDPHVSRAHCEIRLDRGRARLRDLGSTNGTYLNGARVDAAELGAGARLRLGASRLAVVVEERAGVGDERSPLLGEAPAMRRLRDQIARLARTQLTVLIQGETGTGKELVARGLHDQSGRRGGFVPVNCGAIPEELVESELFGHERGAFTGAAQRRAGLFAEADHGTLFLDEVGELRPSVQTRLLRALETRRVRPVGATRELPVEVRVVAATHVDLRRAVAEGRFRADLYFRLAGAELATPALRDRPEDLPGLCRHFLDDLAGEGGPVRLSDEAMQALARHAWPGNVRELRHVLERAVVFGGPLLGARDLALHDAPSWEEVEQVPIANRPFVEIEKEIYRRALRRHAGNRRAAAHALGIPKSTLCDKVRRYGLTDE